MKRPTVAELPKAKRDRLRHQKRTWATNQRALEKRIEDEFWGRPVKPLQVTTSRRSKRLTQDNKQVEGEASISGTNSKLPCKKTKPGKTSPFRRGRKGMAKGMVKTAKNGKCPGKSVCFTPVKVNKRKDKKIRILSKSTKQCTAKDVKQARGKKSLKPSTSAIKAPLTILQLNYIAGGSKRGSLLAPRVSARLGSKRKRNVSEKPQKIVKVDRKSPHYVPDRDGEKEGNPDDDLESWVDMENSEDTDKESTDSFSEEEYVDPKTLFTSALMLGKPPGKLGK